MYLGTILWGRPDDGIKMCHVVRLRARVQLNVGLRFRKSVDYIRHEEVTAEKGRLGLKNPRISIRGIWVAAFGFPRAEPWSPRFNCTMRALRLPAWLTLFGTLW
jgi:hypothetical protein